MATLTTSTRYTDLATSQIWWVPSIAATNLTPTGTELRTGGTRLDGEINDLSGFTVEGEQIDTQAMGQAFRSRIPGATTAPDSSITFYASKSGVDIRALNPRGTSGFLCFLDGGDIPGNKMETYPVTVTSVGIMRSVDGSDAAKVQISYSITREPGQNLTIPA
jgi:hypothetical protein